jgi:carboxylesterase type B
LEIVFGTFARENATKDEYALSDRMRGAWARFAKNPEAGPGWSAIGDGNLDVAVFKNGGEVMGRTSQRALDEKCALWREVIGASD